MLILYSPYLALPGCDFQVTNDLTAIKTQFLSPSDSIYNSSVAILSDADFVLQNWPGNGTKSQPYLISNLRFSSTEDWPIKIYNTRAYFLVSNCVVESSEMYPAAYDGKGIILNNVTNGIIVNCSISNKNAGVYISDANNTIVRNNLIIACDIGISIHRLERCTFSNNSIRMGYEGIQTYKLRFSNLTGNLIVESHTGLGLSVHCTNNTISMNRIGWCIESNAKDFGSNNIWIGNSWSDWNGQGPYVIPGSAGSIDESPLLFDEDVIAPMFEFYTTMELWLIF